jgi:hypothetical protein
MLEHAPSINCQLTFLESYRIRPVEVKSDAQPPESSVSSTHATIPLNSERNPAEPENQIEINTNVPETTSIEIPQGQILPLSPGDVSLATASTG